MSALARGATNSLTVLALALALAAPVSAGNLLQAVEQVAEDVVALLPPQPETPVPPQDPMPSVPVPPEPSPPIVPDAMSFVALILTTAEEKVDEVQDTVPTVDPEALIQELQILVGRVQEEAGDVRNLVESLIAQPLTDAPATAPQDGAGPAGPSLPEPILAAAVAVAATAGATLFAFWLAGSSSARL